MTEEYRQTIKDLSDRIVEAQRPIKVLAAINWDDSVREKFYASKFKEQPAIDRGYYEARGRDFDPDGIKEELAAVKPFPAVFDRQYVKRLDGPNVKKGKNKMDLAEQLVEDIRRFKADNGLDRVVLIWCGSTEVFMTESPVHQSLAAFEKGLRESDPSIPSSMIYAYAAIREGLPYANAAPATRSRTSATHSTCWVCGNTSNGVTRSSRYSPPSTSRRTSRARVAGWHET